MAVGRPLEQPRVGFRDAERQQVQRLRAQVTMLVRYWTATLPRDLTALLVRAQVPAVLNLALQTTVAGTQVVQQ